MSKKERPWTDVDAAAARAHGWELADVYDLKKKKPLYVVLGINGVKPDVALRHVIVLAKNNDTYARKALHLVSQGYP
jgi:hypothetical protein